MSSSKCELVNGLVLTFSIVASCSILLPIEGFLELMILRLLALALTIAHIHYAICVIQQMCDHLNINCLSLKKRGSETSRQHLLSNSNNSANDSNHHSVVHHTNPISFVNELANGSDLRSVEDEQISS